MAKAKSLYEFMNVFSPFPLDGDNFTEFYVDTAAVRGMQMKKMEMTCLHGGNPYSKILFSGQRGSGKTTEIYKLVEDLSSKYEVVRISLMQDLDIYNLSYIELIFEIMSAVVLHVSKMDGINEENLSMFDQLYDYWHSEHFMSEITGGESDISMSVAGEGGVSQTVSVGTGLVSKIRFLVKLSLRGQGIFKTSAQAKDDLKVKIEPKVHGLIDAINDMLAGISHVLAPRQLLVVIEDLGKADACCIEELFGKHQTQLFALNVKTIYTLPVYFEYASAFKRVKDNADASYVLNTISVLNRDGTDNDSGIQFLKQIVYKRAEQRFFNNEALELMIRKSGGMLRDLFALLVDASLNAIIDHQTDGLISLEDAEKACIKLRTEYIKAIETEKHYQRLIQIYSDPEDTFEDSLLMDLLKANMVIECGEDKFCLIHPLIVDYMKRKGDIL